MTLCKNLVTFTLQELKIRMKHLNFSVTRMKRNQVIQLITNYRFLFPHLMNKTGSKRRAKRKTNKVPPASIKLPPELLQQLTNQVITR